MPSLTNQSCSSRLLRISRMSRSSSGYQTPPLQKKTQKKLTNVSPSQIVKIKVLQQLLFFYFQSERWACELLFFSGVPILRN